MNKIEMLFNIYNNSIKKITTMSTIMNLRSGRSIMRRDSRNYEEFHERKKYQEELAENARIDNEEEPNVLSGTEIKFNQFKYKLKTILDINEHQKKNNCSLIDKMKTVKRLYELIKDNIDVLIHMHVSVYKDTKKLPLAIIETGRTLIGEMISKIRSRNETKLYRECRELIVFVINRLNTICSYYKF
jgi:hypothetical protein